MKTIYKLRNIIKYIQTHTQTLKQTWQPIQLLRERALTRIQTFSHHRQWRKLLT